ncbi:hypothetical protein VZC37_06755 [Gordonia sp. LSe1-13]|uniref:Uncharacterized protein n=1 Tax=Gordonia sesuvii TaxID=3116777 RepID=A0ABU7MAD2_9ACTN|nr:hypothetical protein [Gordonia sp. LSe1-13]
MANFPVKYVLIWGHLEAWLSRSVIDLPFLGAGFGFANLDLQVAPGTEDAMKRSGERCETFAPAEVDHFVPGGDSSGAFELHISGRQLYPEKKA